MVLVGADRTGVRRESLPYDHTTPSSGPARPTPQRTRGDAWGDCNFCSVSFSHYKQAAICKRGHVATSNIERAQVSERCVECGAPILTQCPACNFRIRGYYSIPNVVHGSYDKPNFCDGCGAALPWVDRKGRIYELQNRLDDEDLDPATELIVREQLEALTDPDLTEVDQVKRWQRIKSAAPEFLMKAATSPIVTTLVTAEAKKQLGLPPA
jgi:hypothetical protein